MSDEPAARFRGYAVVTRRFELAGRRFELLGPADCESLLDDPRVARRFAQDGYLPYWAQVWPASLLLAEAVAAWGPAPAGAEPPLVLEIGCGLGLVSLLAAHLGYRVLATDYELDALAFLAENARRNGLRPPRTRRLDWRAPALGLRADRIVAADVLYETRHLHPVAAFIHGHLRPDGLALVCDADRATADDFETVARRCGLAVEVARVRAGRRGQDGAVAGRLFRLRRRV